LAWQAASVIGVLFVLRIAWMYAVPAVVSAVRRLLAADRVERSRAEQFVLGWSGMRGALSLAAALSLPLSRAHTSLGETRGTLIFLSFAAIFVTLVLPGVTLAPLIRGLGLGQSERRRRQALDARLRVMRAALTRLDELASADGAPERSVARLRDVYQTRTSALEQALGEHQAHHLAEDHRQELRLRGELLAAQRVALHELGAERAAPAEVLREIERELDLEAARSGSL
jgi:CPA1 family monovalent cation:H+ antiporter